MVMPHALYRDLAAADEVLTYEAGTTWTIIVTQPGGASCIVATGEDWVWRQPKTLDPEA